jgi:hypothetical protein
VAVEVGPWSNVSSDQKEAPAKIAAQITMMASNPTTTARVRAFSSIRTTPAWHMAAFLKRRADRRIVMLGQKIAYFCRLADSLARQQGITSV